MSKKALDPKEIADIKALGRQLAEIKRIVRSRQLAKELTQMEALSYEKKSGQSFDLVDADKDSFPKLLKMMKFYEKQDRKSNTRLH